MIQKEKNSTRLMRIMYFEALRVMFDQHVHGVCEIEVTDYDYVQYSDLLLIMCHSCRNKSKNRSL